MVVAVTPRSDAYPEIPWKAFASASPSRRRPPCCWPRPLGPRRSPLLTAVLAVGLVAGPRGHLRPARSGGSSLGSGRAEHEARQHAGGIFLERELFRTRERDGILLLASLYERRLVLLADARVRGMLGPEELARPVTAAIPLLSSGRTAEGMLAALEELEAVLLARGFTGGGADEIAEELIVDPEAGGDR